MRTFKIALLTLSLAAVVSCSDDDKTTSLSNEEAAEIIASSLAQSTSGIASVVEEATTVTGAATGANAVGRANACVYDESLAFSRNNAQGAAVTYSYQYSYHYQLACTGQVSAANMAVDVDFSGMFDGPRMKSWHTGIADLQISSLDETSSNYVVNGAYARSGSFQSMIRNQNTSTSVIDLLIDNLTVNKTSKLIMGGSATVTIEGTATGGTFTVTASVVFQGDRTAEVAINGVSYTVNLSTGTVTAN